MTSVGEKFHRLKRGGYCYDHSGIKIVWEDGMVRIGCRGSINERHFLTAFHSLQKNGFAEVLGYRCLRDAENPNTVVAMYERNQSVKWFFNYDLLGDLAHQIKIFKGS